jgi:transcriptional regulator with XRE-family HTH domain
VETPRVAASAGSDRPLGWVRPDSSDGTVARESPEIRPRCAAEMPASARTLRSLSPIEFMTTPVAQATNVVKLFPLTPVRRVATARRVLLHERIAWVQADLGSPEEPASLALLAERAGVSRQLLQQWVTKSRAGQQPGRGETFTRCAKAWKVSLEWLQSGIGEPRPSAFGPLEQALDLEPWALAAVAAARAHYEAGARLSLPEWHRFLRAIHELANAPLGDPRVIQVKEVATRRPKRDAG